MSVAASLLAICKVVVCSSHEKSALTYCIVSQSRRYLGWNEISPEFARLGL